MRSTWQHPVRNKAIRTVPPPLPLSSPVLRGELLRPFLPGGQQFPPEDGGEGAGVMLHAQGRRLQVRRGEEGLGKAGSWGRKWAKPTPGRTGHSLGRHPDRLGPLIPQPLTRTSCQRLTSCRACVPLSVESAA